MARNKALNIAVFFLSNSQAAGCEPPPAQEEPIGKQISSQKIDSCLFSPGKEPGGGEGNGILENEPCLPLPDKPLSSPAPGYATLVRMDILADTAFSWVNSDFDENFKFIFYLVTWSHP